MLMELIGLGAGGHAKGLIEIIRARGEHSVAGLLSADASQHGSTLLGAPVLGGDELLPALLDDATQHDRPLGVFIAVGTVRSTHARQRLFDWVRSLGITVVDIVHPNAVVSPSATIATGVTMMAGVVVGADARIGVNVLLNTGAIVEHDCTVDDHVHVATGARLTGGVRVGRGALIGAGSCLLPGVTIGQRSIVGAGAVVTADVPNDRAAVGVPARVRTDLGV
jgi:UDP-perosamine 4-acetyltransferase